MCHFTEVIFNRLKWLNGILVKMAWTGVHIRWLIKIRGWEQNWWNGMIKNAPRWLELLITDSHQIQLSLILKGITLYGAFLFGGLAAFFLQHFFAFRLNTCTTISYIYNGILEGELSEKLGPLAHSMTIYFVEKPFRSLWKTTSLVSVVLRP